MNYEEVLRIVFFYIIDSSVVGYVHMVSPVKSGARSENIRYYNMMMQISEDIYRSVLYCEDLRDQLLKVEKNRCPVKLFNIKRKMNFRDPSETDIEINNKTELEEQDEVAFKFRKVSEDVCPVVTVGTALKEKKHNDYVFFHCYVNIEDRPLVSTTLRYQTKTITKKDVTCNDDTGTIKLTL